MPKLEAYDKKSGYSYAPGIFPAAECLRAAPERCLRLLYASDSGESEGVLKLREGAEALGIRCECADRALRMIARKENCHAAMVFRKEEADLAPGEDHLVLVNPGDFGNLGAIMRSALGFGFRDVAVIRPAADTDDPRTVRASMGAVFSLRIRHFDSFRAYQSLYPEERLFPFMLTGSLSLPEAEERYRPGSAILLGNEGSGLPDEFSGIGTPVRIPHSRAIDSLNVAVAAGIGMYAFSQRRAAVAALSEPKQNLEGRKRT